MNFFKVCGAGLLAAVAAGCWSHDTGGTAVTPDVVAGLRYVNLVSDTAALNFRVVDVINNAPNSINAVFRTGGNPYGVTTTFLPMYFPVDAGTRHIKVFLYSTIDTLATKVVLDTTFTFVQNTNYTFYLYGYARTGSNPKVQALITTDAVPSIAAGKIALRVLNLAPTLAGNPIGSAATAIDARVGPDTGAVPLAVTAGLPVVGTNLAFGQMSGYTAVDASGSTIPYRLAAMASASASPIMFQANLPLGVAGNSTTNPIGGSAVAGTAMTAIIVPASVAGSGAPQSTPSAVSTNIDSIVRNLDTVTVWRHITPGNGSTTCNAAVAAGAGASDIITVAGTTQPEYSGSHAVHSVTAGTSQTLFSEYSVTLSGGTAGNTFRLRFPATTGAPVSLPITYDADSATVRAILEQMSTIGTGNVRVSGAAGGPYTIRFIGAFANSFTGPGAIKDTLATAPLTTSSATLPVACTGTATSSRFRYRIAGTPVSPATGNPTYSFKVVTPTNEYLAPTVLFILDNRPPQTAP